LAEIAHAGRIIGIDYADGPGPAAAHEPQKDPQAVGIGKRLENLGKIFDFFGFTVRHVSNYSNAAIFVKHFFKILYSIDNHPDVEKKV